MNDERERCQFCGNMSALLSEEEEIFLYGSGKEQVSLAAWIPVHTCTICGGQSAEEGAEKQRAAAIDDYLALTKAKR